MSDNNDNLENEKIPVPQTNSLKGVGGWLLLFIIGTFLSFLWNFMAAVQSGSNSFIGGGYMIVTNPYVSSLLGLFALVTGIMLIAVRNIYAVWTARIYMILYLLGSIIIAITGFQAPSGYYVMNEEAEIIRGIFSSIMLNLIWQSYFIRSKRVKATYSITPADESDLQYDLGKTFASLFNKQKLGINYYVGLGLFLLMVISWFLYAINDAIWYGYGMQLPSALFFFAFRIPLAILYSLLLIFLLHTLKNDWLIAVAMGFGTTILSLIFRLILSGTSFGNITLSVSVTPAVLLFNFTWSFFILLSLALAMRIWGFKWWSFVICVPIGNLVEGLVGELINLIQYKEYGFSFSFLPISILQGIIEGAVFYFSIYFFLRQKGGIVNKAA